MYIERVCLSFVLVLAVGVWSALFVNAVMIHLFEDVYVHADADWVSRNVCLEEEDRRTDGEPGS
jgi:hypothetical protein